MIKFPDSYIVWDLETSGLSPVTDKILEIGAIGVNKHFDLEKKSWLINHGIEVSQKITEITGITNEEIKEKGLPPEQALSEFFDFFRKYGPANLTHNGYRFDINFLYNAVDDHRKKWIDVWVKKNFIDTAVLFKARQLGEKQWWNESFTEFSKRIMNKKIRGLKFNVAYCCDALQIDTTKIQLHRALADCEMTYQIYKKIIK